MMVGIAQIAHVIESSQLNLTNEKILQLDLSSVLTTHGIKHEREIYLDEHNIIDFMFESGVGMEVKIKGTPKNIYRQLVRYSEFEQIKSIILATNKSMGLPKLINNKPTYIINLNRGWL